MFRSFAKDNTLTDRRKSVVRGLQKRHSLRHRLANDRSDVEDSMKTRKEPTDPSKAPRKEPPIKPPRRRRPPIKEPPDPGDRPGEKKPPAGDPPGKKPKIEVNGLFVVSYVVNESSSLTKKLPIK